MDEADAMKITGHQTAHVFRRYDLGDVEALRQRLTRARKKAATITRLRDSGKQRATRDRWRDPAQPLHSTRLRRQATSNKARRD
jgi:hypothetical protein